MWLHYKKDRVFAALGGKVPDRPPCGEIAFPGRLNDAASLEHFIYMLNTDVAVFSVDHYASDFTLTFENPSDIKYFTRNSDCFLLGGVPGVFWPSAVKLGFETAARMSVKYPQEYRNIIRNLKEKHLRLALELIENGADGIMIFDDLAGSKGLFFSPAALRNMVFPELSEFVFKIKAMKKPVFFHSDGQIIEVLSNLMNMGIDVIHGFEGKTPDEIEQIKGKFSGRAAFMGNISPSYGERDEYRIFSVIKQLQNIFKDGRYIFSSDGGLSPGTMENLNKVYSYFHLFWRKNG